MTAERAAVLSGLLASVALVLALVAHDPPTVVAAPGPLCVTSCR